MDRIKYIIFVCLSVFSFTFISCQTKNYEYISLPKEYINSVSISNVDKNESIKLETNLVSIESYLPKNYVKDASVDYTIYLQKALDENTRVLFPNFPVLVNDKGLSIRSNSSVYFNVNSKIILKANNKAQYEIIRIHNVENVKLYYPVIEGDKYSHLDQKGEWGMGISIRGTKNIEIFGAKVSKCWGDGIYLGITDINKRNINIKIINTILDDNRRNGMSIISAEYLLVENILSANTSGIAPMAGIDIEPNLNTDVIGKMVFNNVKTFNNKEFGFLFVLNNLFGDLPHNNIDINVNKLDVESSNYGLVFKLGNDRKYKNSIKGNIKINNFITKSIRKKDLVSYEVNNKNKVNTKIILNKNNLNYTEYKKELQNSENFEVIKNFE